MKLTRRTALAAGGLAAVAGAGLALRPRDHGAGGHGPYFAAVSAALKRAGIAQPTLVIDRQRLRANIAQVRRILTPTPLGLRIVSKSLQAPALLAEVMDGTGARALMAFNAVMLEALAGFRPQADILLGRPLPAVQAAAFIDRHQADAAPAAAPQWLIDTPGRLAEYAAIARARRAPMKVNLEIDVGLHRGGLADAAAVAQMVRLARTEPLITLTGLMGYDAHVAAVPFPDRALAAAKGRYAEALAVLTSSLGTDPARLTLNTAGSPTFMRHLDDRVANEVAIGSCFVKPADFDLPDLARHLPACFIAEPVLKVMDQALIPSLEWAAPALDAVDPNSRRGIFVYGGYGEADPVSPPGLAFSPLYGERAMLIGSRRVAIAPDDIVFFRPRESEGVFLQYGDLAVYDGGEVVARWPVFPTAA